MTSVYDKSWIWAPRDSTPVDPTMVESMEILAPALGVAMVLSSIQSPNRLRLIPDGRIRIQRRIMRFVAVLTVTLVTAGNQAVADEGLSRVTFTDESKVSRTIDGKLLVEAVDGGLLLLGRDGRLWNIVAEQFAKREEIGETFEPLSAEEFGAQLQAELGDEFEIVRTKHYVICTNAGEKYGRWCGSLFERLMAAFHTHWRTRALGLHEPRLPLAAIVFADRKQFFEYAAKDAGPDVAGAKGYYSIRTNRMVLYDLTSTPNSSPARTTADINRMVSASPFNVATVVHEATHQIAFNCGLHRRYADNPLWLTEGMAMYFETPDLRSRSGWRTIGKVNPMRWRRFYEYFNQRRRDDSLVRLLRNNERFGNPKMAEDAYAEAWALTHFLIKTKRKRYLKYLKRISGKPRLIWDTPKKRVDEFKEFFGDDLPRFDRDFLRFVLRLSRQR